MDEFIDDETLLHIYDAYDWESEIEKHFGLSVEIIETGCVDVFYEDIREENENE